MAKSILIVDDNARIRQFLVRFLQNHPAGFLVHEAYDGLEAVEKIPQLLPDLVVMDLSMPRMNGLQAARRLRALQIQVPIILFTMHAPEASTQDISAAGINAVVEKPDFAKLQEQVDFFLGS